MFICELPPKLFYVIFEQLEANDLANLLKVNNSIFTVAKSFIQDKKLLKDIIRYDFLLFK
ncbi:unnamed protein product, partial [marine sediment metagenome]